MKKNIPIINKNGFSLLEITVVLIVISILLSAVIPVLSRSYLERAANKTALDISAIQEASRRFYIDNNQWPVATSIYPTPITVLQAPTNGDLPAAWSAINPFGTSAATPANYSYIVLPPSASLLTVCTFVPSDAQNIILNSLASSYVDANGNVCSSISVPGSSSVLPTGSILAWSTATIPAGFIICDGSVYSISSYPALGAVLGSTYGGNGTTTFAVPDLRGRTIVGVNTLTTNDGTNRIWPMDEYPDNQPGNTAYAVDQMGGVFGEEQHHLTIPEMPSHHFQVTLAFTDYNMGGDTNGLRNDNFFGLGTPTYATNSLGDDVLHNVVQPSMALEYLIKT